MIQVRAKSKKQTGTQSHSHTHTHTHMGQSPKSPPTTSGNVCYCGASRAMSLRRSLMVEIICRAAWFATASKRSHSACSSCAYTRRSSCCTHRAGGGGGGGGGSGEGGGGEVDETVDTCWPHENRRSNNNNNNTHLLPRAFGNSAVEIFVLRHKRLDNIVQGVGLLEGGRRLGALQHNHAHLLLQSMVRESGWAS